MTDYLFNPPTVAEGPAGGHRLFEFYKLDRGITIIKDVDGEYYQVRYPEDELLRDYLEVYLGGREYIVTDTKRQELIDGNVGVTEENFEPASS